MNIEKHIRAPIFSKGRNTVRGFASIIIMILVCVFGMAFRWNPYVVVFAAAMFLLLFMILFERFVVMYPERLFVVYALVFGLIIITFNTPQHSGWDDPIHFEQVYKLSFSEKVIWTEAARKIVDWELPRCKKPADYKTMTALLNEEDHVIVGEEPAEGITSYKQVGYILQALALRIARALCLPFTIQYYAGEAANLCLYVVCMYLAIKMARAQKLLLLYTAMTPSMLYSAVNYTYDTTVICFLTLGIVIWRKMADDHGEDTQVARTGTWINYVLFLILVTAGSLPKLIYIPIVMVVFCCPCFFPRNRKRNWRIHGILLTAFVFAGAILVIPWLKGIFNGSIQLGGDPRGGDTDASLQLISMFRHPLATFKLLLGSILRFENFRNTGTKKDYVCFANQLFLNHFNRGVLSDKWTTLLVPSIMVFHFYKDPQEGPGLDTRKRVWAGIWLMVVIVLIWTSMYLVFTPIGGTRIYGVQTRYFLPLLYGIMVVIEPKHMRLSADRNRMYRAAMLIPFSLESVCVWSFIIAGRLI